MQRVGNVNAELRKVVALVGLLNLFYFVVEFFVALSIGSVSLFADSADFFEDASVNFLIFVALTWTAQQRSRVGMLLSGVLLLPALAFLWALWSKVHAPIPPSPVPFGITGAGALLVNLSCALMLSRHRGRGGSLMKAAFLSARNDVLANVAIIGASLVIALHASVWPDIVVGLVIACMNVDAAKEVWKAAREERLDDTGR